MTFCSMVWRASSSMMIAFRLYRPRTGLWSDEASSARSYLMLSTFSKGCYYSHYSCPSYLALPEDTIGPRGDAMLLARVIVAGAHVKLVRRQERELGLVVRGEGESACLGLQKLQRNNKKNAYAT